MNDIFTHTQEIWDKKECAKRANYAPADFWGNRPPKGIIAYIGSNSPQYGQTIRYNGGKIIDGKLFSKECRPLPKIHSDFEIIPLSAWGKIIRKKS